MQAFLLNTYKTVNVYLDKNKPLTVPVAECRKGRPVVLPRRPDVFYVKKGKYKQGFFKAYAGFDIETTNVITEEYKRAYMYIWQFAIVTDKEGVVYLGRTWDDFLHLIDEIVRQWRVSPVDMLIIWDANLSFEFQFIRKRFEWLNDDFYFFAKEERKPLIATTTHGIQFRECLSISGGSLAQLAKDYCTTQKLVGDLDYKIVRNHTTPLTSAEMDYCINDVVILAEWSKYVFDAFIRPFRRVPLTKTGLLRRETKTRLKDICGDLKAYMQMVNLLYPDEETYLFWFSYLFRGGYVHSNYILTNMILNDVQMYDITSSYPARMNLSYFPVSKFVEIMRGNFDELLKTKCCIMIAEFTNIRARGTHSIESLSKCVEIDNYRLDNGRIAQADRMVVALTELDYDNYSKFYEWDKMHIRRFWAADRGRLPRFILDVLNHHYAEKSRLKAAGLKDSPEYAICKSGVNSAYGLMVTKMQLEKITYNDGWTVDDVPLQFDDEAARQFLLPQWGIWVAAHARHEVLTMIDNITRECGNIVVYCDTDSVKCLKHPDVKRVIREYNDGIKRDLQRVGLYNVPGFSDLGMFDFEGVADRFKTLGAKRYMVDMGGKITATIAGFPKSAIKRIDGDPFDAFDVMGMRIAPEKSEKLTTCYNDSWHGEFVGGVWEEEQSSVALYEIPFSMMTDRSYYELLIAAQDSTRTFGARSDG